MVHKVFSVLKYIFKRKQKGKEKKRHLLVSRQFLGRTEQADSFQLISCALIIKESSVTGNYFKLIYKLDLSSTNLKYIVPRVIPTEG